MDEIILEADRVFCGYDGADVVKGLSLKVKKGEILSLTGANGCGKTTLLRAFMGIIPYRGEIRLDKTELRAMSRRELSSRGALMTQYASSGDYSAFTVYDAVLMGRYSSKKGFLADFTPEDKAAAEDCMAKTGISDLRDCPVDRLSGGQLQRVFLARAFAQSPRVIFLDEPSNHLDLKYRFELVNLLRDWVAEGKSAVAVFHDISLAAAVSDRMALMEDGKCVLCGTPREVCSSAEISRVYGFDVPKFMRGIYQMWQ